MTIIKCDRCKKEQGTDIKKSLIALSLYDDKGTRLDLCKQCQKEIYDYIYKSKNINN